MSYVIGSCFECPHIFVSKDDRWVCKQDEKNPKEVNLEFILPGYVKKEYHINYSKQTFPYWCELQDYYTEQFVNRYDYLFDISTEAKTVLAMILNTPIDFWNSFVVTKRIVTKGRQKDRMNINIVRCHFCGHKVRDGSTYYKAIKDGKKITFCYGCRQYRRLDHRLFEEREVNKSNLRRQLKKGFDLSYRKIDKTFKEIESFMVATF